MSADQETELRCSIARALEIVGDKWTLLIVREAAKGSSRFSEFHEALGIAKDVLGARLVALVNNGILLRQPYRDGSARSRHEYLLTAKGRDLLTVLGALGQWGEQYRPIEKPPYLSYVEAETGAPLTVQFVTHEGRQVEIDGVEVRLNPELSDALTGPG
jgi:DNA-binding HxlR family transcriptional regulator